MRVAAQRLHTDCTTNMRVAARRQLVKRDNRKKHNSHEWFLKGFCDDVGVISQRVRK